MRAADALADTCPDGDLRTVQTTVADGMFRLTAHADRATCQTHDAIGMEALVTFLGPATSFPGTGSGSGLVRRRHGPTLIGRHEWAGRLWTPGTRAAMVGEAKGAAGLGGPRSR